MRFLLISLLVFTTSSVNAQFERNLADIGLKGKVKSLSETEFQITDRYGKQSESRRYYCTFDLQGNKVDDKQGDPSGATLFHTVYKYDKDGRLINMVTTDTEVNLDDKRTYVYEGNKIIEKASSVTQPIHVTAEYEYDNVGRLIKNTEILNDKPRQTTTYTYNSAGCKTAEDQRSSEGSEIFLRYTCNDKGQATVKTEVDAAGKELFRSTYKYDAKGSVISEASSYTGDPDQTVITYEYQYDSQGNWTERKETMNGTFFSVILRRFQYY